MVGIVSLQNLFLLQIDIIVGIIYFMAAFKYSTVDYAKVQWKYHYY